MPNISKVLHLGKSDYFETHLSIINCFLPVKMTPMEISVMAIFMSLEGDLANYRFSSVGKKIVKEKLGISASGLSNYMRELTLKKFLREDDKGNITILPILSPSNGEQIYMFKLVNEDHA